MSSKSNKKYWDGWNIKYSDVWKTQARQVMSKKEISHILSKLSAKTSLSILDIGVGNGRILEALNRKSSPSAKIFGLDISDKMIAICKRLFKDSKKVLQLRVCDLSSAEIPYKAKFDFVTVIRVLKYNSNWRFMLKKIYKAMKPKGFLVFTMPNNQSISILSGDKFSDQNSPIIYSNPTELKNILLSLGFEKIEIVAFSKLPNFLYHLSENKKYVSILLRSEELLEKMLGKSSLGRELFVSCIKL